MRFHEITEAAKAQPPAELYHGTSQPIVGTTFRPLTHFGSLKAALRRSRMIHGPCYIYKVSMTANNPLRIRDGKNWQHSPVKLADILYYTIKAIDVTEREYIFGGGDSQMAARIVEVMSKTGYDSFVYKNTQEDPGHTSWVNLTSGEVSLIGEPQVLSMVDCYELELSS